MQNLLTTNPNISIFYSTINTIWKNFLVALPNLILAALVLLLFYFLSRLAKKVLVNLFKNRHGNLGIVFGRLGQWSTLLLGTFISCLVVFPSFKANDFIAGLGIGSIAIGFAFKDIFQNLLSGILILLNEPFTIGDVIKLPKSEIEGTVTSINTRATEVKTAQGLLIVVPNSVLYSESVTVNTKFKIRRTDVELFINLSENIPKAISIISEVLNTTTEIEKTPSFEIDVSAMQTDNLKMTVKWWLQYNLYSESKVKTAVITKIQQQFVNQNINFPSTTNFLLERNVAPA